MKDYGLYVESGPKRRTTQVHVLDLLGCVVPGRTTEEALERTPDEIRRFLALLEKHGERQQGGKEFTTHVEVHVTEGSWIGQGDPVAGFEPDFRPLSAEELRLHLLRLSWIREESLEVAKRARPDDLTAKPEQGRAVWAILEHAASAHYSYVRTTVGKVEGLLEAVKEVQQGPPEGLAALPHFWDVASKRLAAMSESERAEVVQHGQKAWTARRGIRRSLEHEWEHLREIERRLDG